MKYWLSLCLLCLSLPALAAQRVVSIGGDVTQIVYALGAGDTLVGRDSTSTKPASVNTLPDVGYMRQLNAEGILALRPDLVLVNDQARPSAVLTQLTAVGVKVVDVTGENSLAAIDRKIATIAAALNRPAQGNVLATRIDAQIAAIPKTPLHVRAIYLMAPQGMTSLAAGRDTAADQAMRSAGLLNVMAQRPHYQTLSQEGIAAAQPDLVIIDAASLKAIGGEPALWKLPGMALTPAARGHHVAVVDLMDLLGFGPDTPAAILALRQAATPLAHD